MLTEKSAEAEIEVQRYLARTRRATRRSLIGAGLVFCALGLLPLVLIGRLTDIGHAAGFGGLSFAMLAGAALIFSHAWRAR